MSDHAPNDLVNSSSPYLKQHAYNPVHWVPWSAEVFKRAALEDKMVLISIGYSACHWCHVMEKQCFEDFEVAEIMNNHFISVKVDREERPDVDQVYMSAVQLMTGRGGWPLNCFTLPDGRPVYGGTYFPKHQWINILLSLSDNYRKSKNQFEDYANRLTEGMNQLETLHSTDGDELLGEDEVAGLIKSWKQDFDPVHGGPNRAPKFPMPVNLRFLLYYGTNKHDSQLIDHVSLTLIKMASGGIYDQLGGGFARYSVDAIWKVPHFEKMLYDNAQLISLYAEYNKWKQDPLCESVVRETIGFIDESVAAPDGGYYCALDADSEGVEGKFYSWTKQELMHVLGSDYDLFAEYYQVDDRGLWEDDRYILIRDPDASSQVAASYGISVEDLNNSIDGMKRLLLDNRRKRINPGLDNKKLTSWNALMAVAFIDAFEAFGLAEYLEKAKATCAFILEKGDDGKGGLLHTMGNGPRVTGFLEDFVFTVNALIRLYQSTGVFDYLEKARSLTDEVFSRFENEKGSMFYFTSVDGDKLISRKTEIQDNVIPASNSQLAINLFFLGHYFEKEDWIERSKLMLQDMKPQILSYPQGHANWLLLWMMHFSSLHEIAVCGNNAIQKMQEIRSSLIQPGMITATAVSDTKLPLTRDRLVDGQTLIYVCLGKSCNLPVATVSEAQALLQQG